MKILTTAADVTEGHLLWAEEVFCGWFDNDEPIDWERFIDRYADPNGYNEHTDPFDIEEWDNAAIRKIKRHVRAYKAQG